MNMKASYCSFDLIFKQASGTSRGVLTTKESWFIKIEDGTQWGIGECGILRGLSSDDVEDYEQRIKWACEHISLGLEALCESLIAYPSIVFGLEQAFMSLNSDHPFQLFDTAFSRGDSPIQINGLIWMGDQEFMKRQIDDKLSAGVRCIKIKVGAIDFSKELELIKYVRSKSNTIEIRLDANGGFSRSNALERLEVLSTYKIHSIEQPLKPQFINELAQVAKTSPIPIALDESLIGLNNPIEQQELLELIKPHYIILKPSFIGGIRGSLKWIKHANALNIGWWVTSALESNIGLNAIAQWTSTLGNELPQGLGTGSLFTNNFSSPLTVVNDELYYKKSLTWESQKIKELCI